MKLLCKSELEALTGLPVTLYDEIPSTNDAAVKAVKEAEAGIADFSVFAALRQSGGRGRGEKSFFSYNGGIYMSIIMRRGESFEDIGMLTSCAAASVCRAIRRVCGLDVYIKWVNDIYFKDKKVCGILCVNTGGCVVCGIGINVKDTVFPESIRETAGALSVDTDLNILAAAVIKELKGSLREERESIISYCRKYSYLIGKRIYYTQNDALYRGQAKDICDDGSLFVLLDSGEKAFLSSGEVSVRRE